MDYNKQMEVYNALAGLDGEKVISLCYTQSLAPFVSEIYGWK